MYLTLRKTTLILKLSTSVLFLQDVLTAQQGIIQALINYIEEFNTGMLDRVGAVEVSTTLLHDLVLSTVCTVLGIHITFYVI